MTYTTEQLQIYDETYRMLRDRGFAHEGAHHAAHGKAEGFTIPPPKRIASGIPAPDVVSIVHGDTITPEPIRWLWPGWLARGKLHVVAGAAGTGKTTLAAAMAATVTTAGRWPDGRHADLGDALIWSGEDDPADTLIPRLLAMGADVSRIHFVGNVHDSRGMRSFDPASDVRLLSERFADCGNVALLIVDPIVSAVSGDSHKNTEVRRNLQPLVDLATMHDCALVGITHYGKATQGRDPLERVIGSVAFGALARIVMGTAKPTQAGESRRLVRAKSNIGPDGGGFEYDLDQVDVPGRPGLFASRVLWGSALEGTARDLLAAVETEPDSENDRSAEADAAAFLRDLLADGPVPSKQVKADADGAGLAWVTIRRAANSLGIKPERVGGVAGRGRWEWSLAAKVLNKPLSCSHNRVDTLAENEHLSTSAPIQWRRVPTLRASVFDGRGVKSMPDTTSDPVSAADYRRASNGE